MDNTVTTQWVMLNYIQNSIYNVPYYLLCLPTFSHNTNFRSYSVACCGPLEQRLISQINLKQDITMC
jgi:hypothetical protein